MKKKLFAGLLALCMVLSLMPIAALAADDTPAEGYSKDTAWDISAVPGTDDVKAWLSLNDDGETYTLYIEGTGAMKDYASGTAMEWVSVRSLITAIEMSEGITHIGDHAFRDTGISTLTIPESVESIGVVSLIRNANLKEINVAGKNPHAEFFVRHDVIYENTDDGGVMLRFFPIAKYKKLYAIPDFVTELDINAMQLADFSTVIIPDSLKKIGNYCFYESKLESITIPDTVTSIGKGILANCANIEKVEYNATGVTTLPSDFLTRSGIEHFKLPDFITEIGPSAFCNSKLISFETSADSQLVSVGNSAFRECAQLKTADFRGNKLNSIGAYAFYKSAALERVTLPDSIVTILDHAFDYTTSLKAFAVPASFVKTTGYYIFQHSGIEEVDVSLTGLEDGVINLQSMFTDASELKRVTVGADTGTVSVDWFARVEGIETVRLFGDIKFERPAFNSITKSVVFDLTGVTSVSGATNYHIGHWATDTLTPIIYYNDADVYSAIYGILADKAIYADANDGGFDADTEFSADEFAEPTRAGYEFLGWYTADGTDDKWGSKVSAPVDGVNVYYAKWKALKPCGVSIVSDTDSLDGDGVVTLTVSVADDALDEGEVEVSCDDKRVFIFENRDGTYSAYLPDITKTYTFTAKYTSQAEGEDRVFDNGEDSCEISVTGTDNEPPVTDPEEEEEDDEPVYRIKIDAGRHGDVTTKPSGASEGATITVYVEPDEGYELDELTVTDRDGSEIELKDMGDGRYRFRMPDSKVNIEASFKKAKEEVKIVLTVGSNVATVNGETVTTDVAPIIVKDRTMLPIRFIAEALGAEVEWVETERKVIITKGDTNIVIFIDGDYAYINGEAVKLDAAAFIEGNRTYLPLRFVAEALGADVVWDADARTVTVTGTK